MSQPNEILTEAAFTRQSRVFDAGYAHNTIVQYKRERVRRHVTQFLPEGGRILELNSGTGEDAIYFAAEGRQVHATDLSAGMLEQLIRKVKEAGLTERVTAERCSFTALSGLQHRGPYDMVFSNFAGLNCTADLSRVLANLPPLVKPGGVITLVLLPSFCLWESLLMFKGKFRTATRRWFSGGGTMAKVEGLPFRCWYHSPSAVQQALGDTWEVIDLEGLCTLVPPSYIEGFAEKRPRLYAWLKKQEDARRKAWPWKYIGDYYIISLRRSFLDNSATFVS